MKVYSGLSLEDVEQWVHHEDPDVRKWVLKPGAPKRVERAFAKFIEARESADEFHELQRIESEAGDSQ